MRKQAYYCDPFLNRECRKTGCFLRGGPCQSVMDIRYAMLNRYGIPVMSDGDEYVEEGIQNENKLEGKIQE